MPVCARPLRPRTEKVANIHAPPGLLAQHPASVVARRVPILEEAKQEIEKEVPGAQVQIVAGDISEPETGKRVVDAAVQAWGKVDIVIANQFTSVAGPINSAHSFYLAVKMWELTRLTLRVRREGSWGVVDHSGCQRSRDSEHCSVSDL